MKMLLISLALVSTSAFALTLKEKKQLEAWNTSLEDASESSSQAFQTKCGYKLPVKLDEKMVTPFMEGSANAGKYCDSVRSSIATMCEDKTSKEAVVKKVKSVFCRLGKGEELMYKFNGTTVEVTMGIGAANIDAKTKEWLENNL